MGSGKVLDNGREPGWYWVKYAIWTPEYFDGRSWEYHGGVADDYWDAIGPRIPEPEEV